MTEFQDEEIYNIISIDNGGERVTNISNEVNSLQFSTTITPDNVVKEFSANGDIDQSMVNGDAVTSRDKQRKQSFASSDKIILKDFRVVLNRIQLPIESESCTFQSKLPQMPLLPKPQSKLTQLQLHSSNATVHSAEQISVADLKIDREASIAEPLKKICEEIRTPEFLLEDTHIDAFTTMANQNSQYNMITVLGAQREEQYERTPEEAHIDDVQILFEGRFGPKSIGHYICIHYRANEQIRYIGKKSLKEV